MKIQAPKRVTRHYTQRLKGSPAEVFPLLCPVREAEWIEGWDPTWVFSASGVAEPDCLFVTAEGSKESIWFITQHQESAGFVEMLKITPGLTACKLQIQLAATESGCTAQVMYQHTSLGSAGDAFVDEFTESHYESFMGQWENKLNHYLVTGKQLQK